MSPTPEATDPREKQAQRVKVLMAEDAQFAAAFPSQEVIAAKTREGLRLSEIVACVMEGYAERPALGRRAREIITDQVTGRSSSRLLSRFETITYGELWHNATSLASEWCQHPQAPVSPGDFVCVLGFTSPDYATVLLSSIHLGAVNVPLQTSAPVGHHADIIAETRPVILATGIDYIEAAVKAVLAGVQPQRLIVLDYDARDDDQREQLQAAREQLSRAGSAIIVDTVDELIQRGQGLPTAPLYKAGQDEDPLCWLFYTSGSTGTPKGAIFTENLVKATWLSQIPTPVITLSFMPMAHLVGNGYLFLALASGGTSYCAPKSDLSTMFEDFSLVRPTMASLVPRVCELFYHQYLSDVDKLTATGVAAEQASEQVKRNMRDNIMGGRLLSVGCGSASLAPETYAFMESMLDMHMPIGYSSTEIAGGTVLVDWKVQRPPVLDYKLDDVPELGYFSTDKPYPRGELLVKSDRYMGGYYKQPDLTAEKFDEQGFYRTGDVMAELGPDHLVYVDRRNNVLKLSQGEFVAISRLEALYSHSPAIRQIYIYGSSERAYLLAVIVPSLDLQSQMISGEKSIEQVKAELRLALKQIADAERLNSYEIPRDFILESEPFSLGNGLLTEVGKHQRPKLKQRYAEALEQLYARIAQEQLDELRELRAHGAERPTLETVSRALQATLGISAADVQPDLQFSELGGDSLSALTFSRLLQDIFAVEVPVGVIISPAGSLQQLADFIDGERQADRARVSFAQIHNDASDQVTATELTLDKFMSHQLLTEAGELPRVTTPIKTVLVTGATGYLGRFLTLSWLEAMAGCDGKVIVLARGKDLGQARKRIEDALASDTRLLARFQALAKNHLDVVAGDLGVPDLGLAPATWQQLAETVDVIVHSGAHVNHVLPYQQLFSANVAGTAELIRLAITTRLKRIHYVSTLGVSMLCTSHRVDESSDIRQLAPGATLSDGYANGYNVSKWASEVLFQEAHEVVGLPVSVFRPGMILAHSEYAGQLNVPDMFTRLLYSLAATGIAPATFYAEDLSNGRPAARYEGFSVDFLAGAITAIGAQDETGLHRYNLSSPREEPVSLDNFVDWLIEAGCDIERVERYSDWLPRFKTALLALPEQQRQQSLLALLGPYQQPQQAATESGLQVDNFQASAQAAGIEIPALSADLIRKYVADLKHIGLL